MTSRKVRICQTLGNSTKGPGCIHMFTPIGAHLRDSRISQHPSICSATRWLKRVILGMPFSLISHNLNLFSQAYCYKSCVTDDDEWSWRGRGVGCDCFMRQTNRAPSTLSSLWKRREREAKDIFALKHFSRIFGHCNDQSIWFVGMASPPVQCSNTGLKTRKKKCWVVAMSENSTDVL